MIAKLLPGDLQGFLIAQQQEHAHSIEVQVGHAQKNSTTVHRSKLRRKLLLVISENKTLLLLAGSVLSEERIKELTEEINEATLQIIDLHFNSFSELRELFNAIPWNMPQTDQWILHDIILRINTRDNRQFHQINAWKLLQKSSREFPLDFALRFWDIA